MQSETCTEIQTRFSFFFLFFFLGGGGGGVLARSNLNIVPISVQPLQRRLLIFLKKERR